LPPQSTSSSCSLSSSPPNPASIAVAATIYTQDPDLTHAHVNVPAANGQMVLKKLREEKAVEDAARAVAAEEQAKLEKKKAKENLAARYKVPSAGFNETDAAVKLAALKARKSPARAEAVGVGADATNVKGGKAGEVPKSGEVHSYGTKKEDEFDIQVRHAYAHTHNTHTHTHTPRTRTRTRTHTHTPGMQLDQELPLPR
jgi:hypothetical protein